MISDSDAVGRGPSLPPRGHAARGAGRMWIHGAERSMTFPGRVRRRDDGLWVRGESPLRMSDFGVGPPRRFFFRVADIVLASFELVLVPGPGGPPGTPRRGGH